MVWLGIVLRSRGIWFGKIIPLWQDEATWALNLIQKDVGEYAIRAPGFMLLSKLLVNVFGAYEATLRFAPWLAGVMVLVLAPLMARDLLRSPAARLLFVAVLALHPAAIDLAKEFKPYSIALLCHLVLLWSTVRYVRDGRRQDLLVAVIGAFVGILFSHDAVLAYPGTFGLLAWMAYRSRRWPHLGYLAAGAVASVVVLLVMFFQVAPEPGDWGRGASYWGNKYNVFFVQGAGQGQTRLGWLAERLYEMSALAGLRRELWTGDGMPLAALQRGDSALWAMLTLGGIVTLLRQRRWDLAVLIGALLVTMLGFNRFGAWPLGAFRTNLFVLLYVALLAAVVFDSVRWASPAALMPAFMLVLLPYLTLGRFSHSRKQTFTAHTALTEAVDEVLRWQGKAPRSALALDGKACDPWRYYTVHHPNKERAETFKTHFNARCVRSTKGMIQHLRSGLKAPRSRAFALLAGEKGMAQLAELPADLHVVEQKMFGAGDAFIARVEKRRH